MAKSWKLWAGVGAAVLLIGGGALALVSWANGRGEPAPEARLPADFEPAGTVVLACHELVEKPHVKTLAELVQAVGDRESLVLLASRLGEQFAVRNALAQFEIDTTKVRFLESPHESSRIGQYGPFWVERPGKGPALIDAPRHALEQRGGAQVVRDLAEGFDLPIVRLAMYLSGGNLISNGQGVAIATTGMLDQNADLGWDEDTIRRTLRQALGIEQLILLQTLEGEPTGHVEWFATFTSADTVVVGQYDARQDEVNAGILDINAKILEEVELSPGKMLKVERIPMPPPLPGVWRSYTPVVFLNGALLMPVYPDVDAAGRKQTFDAYTRLLPDRKIVPIDMRSLEASGVALRSLVLRMGQ